MRDAVELVEQRLGELVQGGLGDGLELLRGQERPRLRGRGVEPQHPAPLEGHAVAVATGSQRATEQVARVGLEPGRETAGGHDGAQTLGGRARVAFGEQARGCVEVGLD